MLVAGIMALAFIGVGAAVQMDWRFPPNSLPWRPLELDQPPHWLAHWQMRQLSGDGALCRETPSRSKLVFTPLADRQGGQMCGFKDAVRSDRSPIAYNLTPAGSCALSAGLYWWQGRLQEIAQREMGAALTRIDQIGIYACRNVNNATSGNRSQHATANAIDIAGFRFADGRTAMVIRDHGKPTPQGRFLAAAKTSACGIFNSVLGPEYNRLHADHFHLDMGPSGICR